MDTQKDPSLRVLMLPWLALGHVSPFFQLAKRIACRNFCVYFCSTAVNLSFIQEELDESLPQIELVELQLPDHPDLPPHCHTTRNIPKHLVPTLIEAFDSAQSAFSNLLSTLNPDCVIYDCMQSWVPVAASHQNIPAISFVPVGCACVSYRYHLLSTQGNSTEYPFPTIRFNEFENQVSSNNPFFKRLNLGTDRSSSIIAIKTSRELEGKFVDYLSLMTGKEVVPVGLLARQVPNQKNKNQPCRITEWLEKKQRDSVLYVSFGSEISMSKEGIEELAYGLELSEVNFIWVVRLSKNEKDGEDLEIEQALPSGFLERVGDRGIVMGWADQEKILSHPNTGGFLTHCGWNSVTEGLRLGVPLIALPLQNEHPIHANLVVKDLGVAVEIKRETGRGLVSFKREKVAKGIKVAMVEKEGEQVRDAAKKMADSLGCKRDEEVDVFVGKLKEVCKQSNGKIME